MTRDEKFKVLDSIKLENDFYPVDEQDCREENASKIDNMEGIFDLKDSSDYTYMFAVAELLADKDKTEAVKDYLLAENSRSKEDVKQPEWEDKLLVSTAMEDNSLFFSMAWNWTSLVEQKLGKQSQADSSGSQPGGILLLGPEDAYDVQYQAAAKTGFHKFGLEHPLAGYGNLGQEGNIERGIFFYITLSEDSQDKVFSVVVEFESHSDGKLHTATLSKDSPELEEELDSEIVKTDITKGIKILKVSVR